MITLGIDLSSQPKNTAVCRIDWAHGNSAWVEPPILQCDDAKLDEQIGVSEVIGIDAPFGWPEVFRAAGRGCDYPQLVGPGNPWGIG